MDSKFDVIKRAVETIDNQSKSIKKISEYIDDDFKNCIEFLHTIKGRIVVTGIGKSAIIGMKIVATLNSTGSPAVFMHATEALHGDLGIIQNNDAVILVSKSGNTNEIKDLVPFLRNSKITLVAITSDKNSFLSQNSDYFIKCFVEKEAGSNNLAPTSSTTAQLVIGDAIAICLSELKGFDKTDFAKFHPAGILGKKLNLKVKDLLDKDVKPMVNVNCGIKEIIGEISQKMLGATAVVENEKIVGIITDGDLRRFLNRNLEIVNAKSKNLMSANPISIGPNVLATKALSIMNKRKISQLLVVDDLKYIGIIHIHKILKEGIE
ncbi:MAG: D-arabinose 5-phosphate isomerase [Flavobacteriaceae bacterium]|nr:D-arabinose 5-phosphate isomerase [Flavobacteriaceae bacterium]